MSVVPLSVALAVGRRLGWVYGSVIRYHRQDAFDALQRSFPGKTDAERRVIVNKMYAHLGMNVVESLRFKKIDDDYIKKYIAFEEAEQVRQSIARGKGSLGLMAHIGNWEMVCAVPYMLKQPASIIVKTIKNKAIDERVQTIRMKMGLHMLPPRDSYRDALRALRKNHLLGFILDQNMTRNEGIFVDYFGRPTCTSPGLAMLSAQTGLPVFPIFIIRSGYQKHVVKIGAPIPAPASRDAEAIRDATQRYTRAIEDMVRAYPEQWIWIHRRWRTAPRE